MKKILLIVIALIGLSSVALAGGKSLDRESWIKILNLPAKVRVSHLLHLELMVFDALYQKEEFVSLNTYFTDTGIVCNISYFDKTFLSNYNKDVKKVFSVAYFKELLKRCLNYYTQYGISIDVVKFRVFDHTGKEGRELVWKPKEITQ